MQRYLSWLGYTAKVFSVGDVREENPEYINVPIEYYDPDNEKVLNIILQYASLDRQFTLEACNRMMDCLRDDQAQVGILDGFNLSSKLRYDIDKKIKEAV